jgi:hypothetical protein
MPDKLQVAAVVANRLTADEDTLRRRLMWITP